MTPASYINVLGYETRSSRLVDHKALPKAPSFFLQDIAGKESDLNLIQFILDTVKYEQDIDHKAANIRPFITPRRQDPGALQRHVLPRFTTSFTWSQTGTYEQQHDMEQVEDSQDQESLLRKAYEAALKVTTATCYQSPKKDVFNDDPDRAKIIAENNSYFNPKTLLSQYSPPLSQEPTTAVETPDEYSPKMASPSSTQTIHEKVTPSNFTRPDTFLQTLERH
jgi:hypothetical protein